MADGFDLSNGVDALLALCRDSVPSPPTTSIASSSKEESRAQKKLVVPKKNTQRTREQEDPCHQKMSRKRKRSKASSAAASAEQLLSQLPTSPPNTMIGSVPFTPLLLGRLSLYSSFRHCANFPIVADTEEDHVAQVFAGKVQLIAGLTVSQCELIACQKLALEFLVEGKPLPSFVLHKLKCGTLAPGEVDISLRTGDLGLGLELAPSFRSGGRELGVKVAGFKDPASVAWRSGTITTNSSIVAVNGVLLSKLEHAHAIRVLNSRRDVVHLRVAPYAESRRNALVRAQHTKIDKQNIEQAVAAMESLWGQ